MVRKSKTSSNGLTLTYGGPIRLSTDMGKDSKPIKVNLTYAFDIQSDSTGAAYNRINIPGLASTTEFVSYGGLYQEFRVLGIELSYVPFFNGSYSAALEQGSGATAIVHIPLTTNPANLDDVLQYATWKPFRTSTPSKHVWRMFGVEESTFASTAAVTSVNHGGIVYYVNGLTPSQTYGKGMVTFLVEFRGRR